MNVKQLVRTNILQLIPYASARSDFNGEANVFLDANENPFHTPLNRYPDPLQAALKAKIAALKHVDTNQIMIGSGSDEPIDLVIRIFCEPKYDHVIAITPTYGMYRVAADVNNVQYKTVPLDKNYTLNTTKVLNATDIHTKVIFLCSPNNPTGNLLDPADVDTIVTNFQGIVVVDEAYIDFAPEHSWLPRLNAHPNLIVLQTFSKAWGLAAVRCGMAFASEEIIDYLNRVKYPYNVNLLTQQTVMEQLAYEDRKNEWVKTIVQQREWLKAQLQQLPIVDKVYHSDANFLLVKVNDANTLYQFLAQQGVIVRNRHTTELCENCIRITVGTQEENNILMQTLCKAVEGNELNDEHNEIYNI